MAVFGRSSDISWGNCSAYGWTVTGSETTVSKWKGTSPQFKCAYLVAKTRLPYCLNQSEYVYDHHLFVGDHRLVNARLEWRQIISIMRRDRWEAVYRRVRLEKLCAPWQRFGSFLHWFCAANIKQLDECRIGLIEELRLTCCWISFILFTFFNSASYTSRSGRPRSVEIFTKNWRPRET